MFTTSRASSTTCSSTSFSVSISPLASSSPSFTWCSYRCYETCYSCCCQPRLALVLVCTALLWGWQLPTSSMSPLPPTLIERLKVKFLIMRKKWNFRKKKWHTTVSPADTERQRRMEASLKLPNLVRSTAGAVPILNEKGKFIRRVSLTWSIMRHLVPQVSRQPHSFNSNACESDVLMHTRVKVPQCVA